MIGTIRIVQSDLLYWNKILKEAEMISLKEAKRISRKDQFKEAFIFRIVAVNNSVCDSETHIGPRRKIKIETETGTISSTIVSHMPNNKDRLMKYLISSCDENDKVDVIIVTSDIVSTVMFDVTQKVIDRNISTNIAMFISKLELKLKNQFYRAICGIRNKTLILNIYGSLEVAITCKRQYEEMILQIVQLIKNKTVNNIKSPIQITDAHKIIRDTIFGSNEEVESECVNVHNAYGRILLKDIYAKCNLPSFRASTKHGYAIKANDGEIKKRVLKAETTFLLESGTCVWVNTGAPIPNGATAVVKDENTKKITTKNNMLKTEYVSNTKNVIEDIETEEEIVIIIQPKEGENIRPIGYWIKMGDKILDKYTCIGLAEIELLASCGVNEVIVIKHQSVGILSIGKLEEPGEILRPKYIYDGNRLTLITLLKQEGFDALDFGIVDDDVDLSKSILKIQEAIEKVNVFVITGSANGRDKFKLLLQKNFKATIHFDCVNIKPGKSITYATCMYEKKKHILCLLGNPSTVLITAHLFLLPLLNQIYHNDSEQPVIPACVMSEHMKYSCPNFVWTHLTWDKKELDTFPKAHSMQHKSDLLNSHNANALLMLSESSKKSLHPVGTFASALFLNSK